MAATLALELYTSNIAAAVHFLMLACGFAVVQQKEHFVIMGRGEHDRIFLNGKPSEALRGGDPQHPFIQLPTQQRGQGVEVIIVVEDLEAAHAAASLLPLRVTPIAAQSWGARDFRVTLEDGYYLQITDTQI